MNQYRSDEAFSPGKRSFAIRTWETHFHENIMRMGKEYNRTRLGGSRRFSVAVKSTFVFFSKLADMQLGKLSGDALQMMMNESNVIPVEVNRNQAARANCNGYSINTIKNHIDTMLEIGMIESYQSYYRVGHKRMYRLMLSKEWLSMALRAEISDSDTLNTVPSESTDKARRQPLDGQKSDSFEKNAKIDNQQVEPSVIQSLTTIYNKKNISNRYNSNDSKGEDKSSTTNKNKSDNRFENLEKNNEGIYEKFKSGQNPSSGNKQDLVLKPGESLVLNSKKRLKMRFAKNLWQQCRSTIFKSMSFSRIQDQQHIQQLILHMDNMELDSNYSKLFDRKPQTIEIYNTLSQAITLAASFQSRTGKSGQEFIYWLEMFLDLEIDLMNGELKNKKYLSLQRWTYDFLPNTWKKNKEKFERGSMKWEEQRIRLYINQIFENILNFAIKHNYTEADLKDKKWKNRMYIMRKLNNSILTEDTKKHLLGLYDLRVLELDKL